MLAVALLQLWALTGHAPQEAASWMAVVHVVFLIAAIFFLAAALTITLRTVAPLRAEQPPQLLQTASDVQSHTPEAASPPPRHTVRD